MGRKKNKVRVNIISYTQLTEKCEMKASSEPNSQKKLYVVWVYQPLYVFVFASVFKLWSLVFHFLMHENKC